jgi:hypothetical protein
MPLLLISITIFWLLALQSQKVLEAFVLDRRGQVESQDRSCYLVRKDELCRQVIDRGRT